MSGMADFRPMNARSRLSEPTPCESIFVEEGDRNRTKGRPTRSMDGTAQGLAGHLHGADSVGWSPCIA